MTKIALVDMDGVLADWLHGLHQVVEEICDKSGLENPLPKEQVCWELKTGDPDADDIIEMAQKHPELYLNLPAIPGAVEGVKKLEALGYDVFICSTPSSKNPNCASHKYEWVRRNLGERFVDKTILTADKTLVCGDILIDDKPVITGAATPSWEHIIFDTPYNQETEGRRLTHWDDIENILSSESKWFKLGDGLWTLKGRIDPIEADELMEERLKEQMYFTVEDRVLGKFLRKSIRCVVRDNQNNTVSSKNFEDVTDAWVWGADQIKQVRR